jgi:hypothetical protein
MRNYRGKIVEGKVGDLVRARCNGREAWRVVEIASNRYHIIIEETPYRIAEDGITLIVDEKKKSRLGETPHRSATNTASYFFLKEQQEEE